ncbi:MAG: ATP synthase F1 subunit delta [Taibaiella sp.]|nr:ATP synthase F1 subunit delta [Taibaiella sp.]
MQNPRLASRYAKSILDLAVERNSLEPALTDMQTLQAICAASHEFRLMLESPVIKGDKKLSILFAVLKSQQLNELTKGFITLLVSKGREHFLPEIATSFVAQYNELKNIKTVKLTTATTVNDAIKNNILAKVAGFMPSNKLKLETSVDESLIGGFVLEMGDKLFDASVKKKLNDVRTKIIDHSYEAKM